MTSSNTPSDRVAYYVTKAGLGRVTVLMTEADCALYIEGAEANGGTGYEVHLDPTAF